MADEAFALSPISARAAMPGEADYDAISEAFMETSRGRWFLSEYAKRNRNADTRMVLDAVARIEQNLAAQKDAAPEHGLAEALATIKEAVDEARATAAALGGAGVDESLAPIRKGAQVIRETLSRLREIGADGRIYDLMDSEVSAIEAGCGNLAATDTKAALNAAFDLIDRRIKQFEGDDPLNRRFAKHLRLHRRLPTRKRQLPWQSPSRHPRSCRMPRQPRRRRRCRRSSSDRNRHHRRRYRARRRRAGHDCAGDGCAGFR